jgi:hypothetical protein
MVMQYIALGLVAIAAIGILYLLIDFLFGVFIKPFIK